MRPRKCVRLAVESCIGLISLPAVNRCKILTVLSLFFDNSKCMEDEKVLGISLRNNLFVISFIVGRFSEIF